VLILGIVMTTVYASYTGAFRIIAGTKTDAELYGMARTTLERMTRDMESVTPWKGAFSFVAKQSFLQDRDFTVLTFRSAAHVAFGQEEQAGGVAVIEYLVEETGEEGGLALYRSDSLDRDLGEDAPPPRKYMVCDRIAGLTCRFYDDRGGDYETWDSEGGGDKQKKKAPTIVEIRMSLINDKNPDNPYPFMTRVYLPATVVK
jgi:hypothetical protein